MRIVRNRYKFLFLFGAFLVAGIAIGILDEVPALALAGAWFGVIVTPVIVLIATRVFRVAEENIEAPRPLWRMTGRPTAGFVLGGVLGLTTVMSLWIEIYGRTMGASAYSNLDGPGGMPVTVVDLIVSAILAVLFFRSSIRLTRESTPVTRTTSLG